VQSLEAPAPTEIRDRLWQQAMLQIRGENALEVFIPVRYPSARDDAEMMSRVTKWEALDDEFFIGFGQKCLITDQAEVSFLDLRQLEFDEPGSDENTP
jgi:protein involved in temperature-dependent protein secretion